jgi:hypothetical protein
MYLHLLYGSKQRQDIIFFLKATKLAVDGAKPLIQ